MLVLAFDTCLDKTYVVLRTKEKVLSSVVIESDEKNYHSAYLISRIRQVLYENGYKPEDIDAIGINIGPGSFTGIRACVTVARVMAQQLGCRAYGISSLEILSRAGGDNSVVALDARKSKAYYYDCTTFRLPQAIDLDEVDRLVEGKSVITDDRLIERFRLIAKDVVSYQSANFELGIVLSDLVIERIERTNGLERMNGLDGIDGIEDDGDWRKVLPLYIQPPPVNV